MIDLINGSNGKEDYIPCPSCAELESIREVIEGYSTFDNESPAVTIDLLVSEVKMWRSKEVYERKLKSTLIASTVKKLQAEGFQINGTPNN
tara:strand:+ start:627 stop:899 length:273 start_codon:yes stop_codon:yes gene_type:complete